MSDREGDATLNDIRVAELRELHAMTCTLRDRLNASLSADDWPNDANQALAYRRAYAAWQHLDDASNCLFRMLWLMRDDAPATPSDAAPSHSTSAGEV